MATPIYLDYNATTPIDPRVLSAMSPFLEMEYGNASSTHAYGLEARSAVDCARTQVARLLNARPEEIVFTGGGSESDNLALKGVAFARLGVPIHIISDVAEHPAVLATLAYLQERFGIHITLLPVDSRAQVDPEQVRAAIRPDTALISIMHANNEVGTLNGVEQIGAIARAAGVLFHVDAAQSAGKIGIDVDSMNIDLLTIAGHKLYATKGIGALYVRRGVELDPLVHGSGQEHHRRAGTENVAGIVGLGQAAALALDELDEENARLTVLRDCLQRQLFQCIPGSELNGDPSERLPNTVNLSFPGVSGAAVLGCTPEVAASTGAACHSGDDGPSGVLSAMGLSAARAMGAVRLSLGRMTTADEIDRAVHALVAGYEFAGGM